jgi:hypothetical protein
LLWKRLRRHTHTRVGRAQAMTTGLCSKTCSKGPLHWLWFYLPSLTLVALSVFLYCVWMFLFIMPIVRKQGMTSSNQMLPIIVIFHVFFGLYVLCLFRTWATDAGRITEVHFLFSFFPSFPSFTFICVCCSDSRTRSSSSAMKVNSK